MAQTAASAMGYGLEVLGFETAQKGLVMVNNVKSSVGILRNQGRAVTAAGIPPSQITFRYDYSDVYNLNSLVKGQ